MARYCFTRQKKILHQGIPPVLIAAIDAKLFSIDSAWVSLPCSLSTPIFPKLVADVTGSVVQGMSSIRCQRFSLVESTCPFRLKS